MKRQYPFSPFPIGWFQVAYSDEITPGQVKPLFYFGKDLVLFRTEAGKACVFDAHCPHLGAHLGHGGTIHGESIRCPFHGWCFEADGTCGKVPYANKIPPRAKVRSWPVCEANGAVMVYHDREERSPNHDVPLATQLTDPDWVHLGRFRFEYPAHLQEMAENAVDPPHLVYLHAVESATGTLQEQGYTARVITKLLTDPGRFGIPSDPVAAQIDSLLCGLGQQIIAFEAIVSGLVFLTFTPIDAERVEARMIIAMKRLLDAESDKIIGDMIVKDIVRQFEEDIVIWSNKVYREKPLLAAGEGMIGPLRRWTKQFYESSGL